MLTSKQVSSEISFTSPAGTVESKVERDGYYCAHKFRNLRSIIIISQNKLTYTPYLAIIRCYLMNIILLKKHYRFTNTLSSRHCNCFGKLPFFIHAAIVPAF